MIKSCAEADEAIEKELLPFMFLYNFGSAAIAFSSTILSLSQFSVAKACWQPNTLVLTQFQMLLLVEQHFDTVHLK